MTKVEALEKLLRLEPLPLAEIRKCTGWLPDEVDQTIRQCQARGLIGHSNTHGASCGARVFFSKKSGESYGRN